MEVYTNNLWLILLPLMPNLFYFTLIKLEDKPKEEKPRPWVKIYTVFERVGVLLLCILILLFDVTKTESIRVYSLAAIGIISILYYICWMRFFNDRRFITLYRNLLFIPIPMALFASLYFIAVSFYLSSNYILYAALIFAFTHIPLSLHNLKLSKQK